MIGQVFAIIVGFLLVLSTLISSLETVVVPRGYQTVLTRFHFVGLYKVFSLFARPGLPFARRDRVMALYAPTSLILLPGMWVFLVITGFTAIFWGTGIRPLSEAFVTSGSSLLTLGFVRPAGTGRVVLAFVEAVIGLGLISIMISYLPTIYGAFSRREAMVGMLEVRAGQPPSTAQLLVRYHRVGWLDRLAEDLWPAWSAWFIDIEESHTSQPSLVFFRSPHAERSWITAAGCVLDTAAVQRAALDMPRDARADMLLRTGFLTLRRIADYFGVGYDPDPDPAAPITVSQAEFEELFDELAAAGLPVVADRDQAWRDYAGWRVNYDTVLVELCTLIMAPPARWSSDRKPSGTRHMTLFKKPTLTRPIRSVR